MGFLNKTFGKTIVGSALNKMGVELDGSPESSSSSSVSGYSTLPASIRTGFDSLGQAASQYTNPNNPGVLERFTPLSETADETAAYNAMRGGFTPTQESFGADLSMLMNPYNQYVINQMNNEAQGEYSILKQMLGEAGQFGSNRQMLGANDIELKRQNQIGSMLQGQYNQALGQIFNNLVPQRQQDAMNLLGVGDRQRSLDWQTRQAPVTALQAGTSMISPFTSSVGSSGASGATPGILQQLGPLAGGVGAAMMASDRRLKENIEYLGRNKGFNIYEFSYKGSPRRFVGVMAQEIQKVIPQAVISTPVGLMVDYSKLGIICYEVKYGL